jgi:type I restriction enzyme S subunit
MGRRGEMGRCAVVTEYESGWLCGTGCLILRLSECVFPRFFVTLIGSPFVREYLEGSAVGATMQNLNQSILLNLVIGLPPLAEQHRIVAKVDELMALCGQLEAGKTEREQSRDRLVAASLHRLNSPADTAEADAPDLSARQADAFRDHARFVFNHLPCLTTRPEHIKQLRQTILNLAVRGKLVSQNPDDEPAIKQQGFFTPNSEIVPFPIPATWCWTTLKSLGRLKGGGTPSKSRPDYWDGEIPWVSPKDMKRDYIATAQLSILQEAIQQSAVNLIEPGSLLFVVRGMILAHSFPVALSRIPLTINQDMKALEFSEPEFGEYLLRALKGLKSLVLAKVQRSSHGTCRLEGTDYSNLPIPIPPLAEQHRIVARVDELMVLCDQLEAQLTTTEADSRRLLEAVLHEALHQAVRQKDQTKLQPCGMINSCQQLHLFLE